MGKYRKLLAGIVGMVVLVAEEFLGVASAGSLEGPLFEGVIAMLTLLGVWGLPNDPT